MNQRQKDILEILERDGYADVQSLQKAVFASESTVRRDLADLTRAGAIRRTHGGAMSLGDTPNRPMGMRRTSMTAEKRAIGAGAASLVKDGEMVFIDTSTTAFCTLESLKGKRGLTVVTNSLPVLNALTDSPFTVLCTGGEYRTDSMGYVGREAEEFAERLCPDWFFFSTPCVGEDGAVTDFSVPETELRRVVLRCAARSVLLFDRSKYGRRAAYRLCDAGALYGVVTDLPATALSEPFAKRRLPLV